MNCKHCIHFSACSSFCTNPFDYNYMLEDGKEKCDCFEDRSLFIRLPCKEGTKYYEIESECTLGENDDDFISCDKEDCGNCVANDPDHKNAVCDKRYYIRSGYFPTALPILGKKYSIGKTIFFSKEEADAKLKELQDSKSLILRSK